MTPTSEGHAGREQRHEQSLQEQAEAIVGECRTLAPGVQALMGFQLIAVFNSGFRQELAYAERCVHLASIALVTVSITLVMAPATYRRLAEPGVVTPVFVKRASAMIGTALGALALSISSDLYLIARVITGSAVVASTVSGLTLVLCSFAWLVGPIAVRGPRPR